MTDTLEAAPRAHAFAQALAYWRLKDFDVGAGEAAKAFDEPATGEDWIDIEAPGDTYLALHAAGRLPDPYGDRAEADCEWVKDREWWQRIDFEAPIPAAGQRLMLDFEGLDTFAAIWLNGEKIGASDNMFLPLAVDISKRVKPGVNRLAVSFTPTDAVVADLAQPLWPMGADAIKKTRRNLVRKAQFGWGWDWGPTFPTVGVWKAATLRLEETAVLRAVKFATVNLTPLRDRAWVEVSIEADSIAPGAALTAEVRLTGPDGSVVANETTALADGAAKVEIGIGDPALWWTPELGDASLYTLSVVLNSGETSLDQRTQRVGVRTIALDTSPDPDEPDTSFFRFLLNGVSIFAKGGCWIPASSFVGALDGAHYRRLIEIAAAGNMNMLRIWGGGVYEHEAFYDACDELGLLVWQDFMFACAPYPEDDASAQSVTAEARAQIERLRNHACVALWCGNNENQVIHNLADVMTGASTPLAGALYYDKILPDLVAELDPTTPYWPGSPVGGPSPNSMLAGDVHDWTVWHGVPPVPRDKLVGTFDLSPEGVAYTRYAEDMGRFISEYGIQASPVMETLLRALPPAERHVGSDGLMHRIKDHPKNKVDGMLVTVTGLPETLDDYVDFTQITQAEGLKFGVEHFRRRTPHCSGSLIWQFNDSWPGISWSLVDYYGFGKASYFYVRRAYAPVMASFKALDGGAMELWVVNDTNAPIEGDADLALHNFAGGIAWAEPVSFSVGPTESRCLWRGEVQGTAAQALTVVSGDHLFPANRHFFAPIKDLRRPAPPAPTITVEAHGPHELAVRISAGAYLYFVHLLVPDEHTTFTDNYFDMPAGETREIVVRNEAVTLEPADVEVRWR